MGNMGLTRRRFLQIGTTAAGGLLVAFHVPAGAQRLLKDDAAQHRLNTFLTIDPTGEVTVKIPVPEIGQGVRTSLAMLAAEELDVPWEHVRVRQAAAADDLGPHPMAGGSFSVRAYWIPLREAGATARAALIGAAAARWGVAAADLEAQEGQVRHRGTSRSLSYGELAAAAAALPIPTNAPLKDPADFRLIGTERHHLDSQAIVTGTIEFGLDTMLPDMTRAVIQRCPTYGGRVRGVDDTAALQLPGVRNVVRVDAVGGGENRPYSVEGVAVVADTTWQAIEGRRALNVDWNHGVNVRESTDRLHEVCQELIDRPAQMHREAGDVDTALATADRVVDATYHAPFLAHAPLEPMNCVVHVREDSCEIWAPTQIPIPVWRNAAGLLDMDPADVTVHVTRVGGGFGRRLSIEFVIEAIQVAQQVDGPVQLVWTRDDGMRHGFFRPFSYHRLRAGLGPDNRITGWLHRQAGTSRYAFRDGVEPGLSEFREGTYPAALAPAYRLEYALADSNIPVGTLRAPGINAFAYAVESFVDEVAHAADRDPVEFRLDLLREDQVLPYGEDDVFETARLRRVIETAAEAADWGAPLPEGRGRGIGAMATFGSYAAQVLEVSVDRESGEVTVHRITGAIDCGRAVNPNGVRAQMEGGALDGLGAALHGEITITRGQIDQRNYGDFPILRYFEAPPVDVHIVDSQAPPTGAGEPPYPPMFAALTNAIYDATGARVRRLPVRPDRVQQALSAVGQGR